MLIMGDRDEEANQVSVRLRSQEDLGGMSVEAFLERAQADIESRA
jgi:threonyl-tRNA synthetase